jgi:Uma2 family endonuclease
MVAQPELVLPRMTVSEFLDWPGDGNGATFQLVDGEVRAMAPAGITHGLIQASLARLLGNHLNGSGCRVVVAPGVIPRVRASANIRVPDLAVTCATVETGQRALTDPVLIIEILSPSNEAETRENVWAYTTIPSLREILLVRSTEIAAELLRRQADGGWPAQPQMIGPTEAIALDSIGFGCALEEIYLETPLVRTRE